MERQSYMIGVDRLFLAEIISDDTSGVSYGTPFPVPGVNSIGVRMNNSNMTIYADDGAFENVNQQGDIDIVCSLAGLSGEKRADVTGGSYNSSTGMVEHDGTDVAKQYALGYRRQKANNTYRYKWFMKGSFARPDSAAATKSGSITSQPMQYVYRALNRANDVMLERTIDSDDANLPNGLTDALLNNATSGWFSSPDYVPVATGTQLSDVVAATGSSAGEIDLTFSAPTNADSIVAQVMDIFGWVNVSTSAEITASSTSATIEGLTASNTYDCRLVVLGGDKHGVSNEDSATAGASA
jgi:phi13 family phage major tail protein